MLAVRLHAAELAVERAATEADLGVDEDVGGDVLAVALEPEARRPRLRRADLEHAQPAQVSDVAIEEHLERVAVRKPDEIVPAELAIDEREHGVDLVVRLVPALGLRLFHPAGRLPELLPGAGQILVEHERDPVLDAEAAAAARARERILPTRERGVAERAAQQLEEGRFHVLSGGQTSGQLCPNTRLTALE